MFIQAITLSDISSPNITLCGKWIEEIQERVIDQSAVVGQVRNGMFYFGSGKRDEKYEGV